LLHCGFEPQSAHIYGIAGQAHNNGVGFFVEKCFSEWTHILQFQNLFVILPRNIEHIALILSIPKSRKFLPGVSGESSRSLGVNCSYLFGRNGLREPGIENKHTRRTVSRLFYAKRFSSRKGNPQAVERSGTPCGVVG